MPPSPPLHGDGTQHNVGHVGSLKSPLTQHADHDDNLTFDRVENITFRLSKPSWRKDDQVAGPSIGAESLSRLDIQKLQSNILRALPTGEHHVVVVKDSDAEEVSVRLELPLPESAEESVEGEPHVRNAAVGVSRSSRESALKKTVNALRSHAFLKELDRLHAIDQQTDRSDMMAGVGTTVGKRSSNVPEGGDEFFFTTLPDIGAGNVPASRLDRVGFVRMNPDNARPPAPPNTISTSRATDSSLWSSVHLPGSLGGAIDQSLASPRSHATASSSYHLTAAGAPAFSDHTLAFVVLALPDLCAVDSSLLSPMLLSQYCC